MSHQREFEIKPCSLHCSLLRHIVSCLLSDVWNYKCQETNWAGWDRAGQAGTVNTTTDGVMVCYHPLLVYLLLCLGKPVPANQGWPTSLLSNSLVSLHLSWQKAKSIPLSDQSSVWMFDVDLMFYMICSLCILPPRPPRMCAVGQTNPKCASFRREARLRMTNNIWQRCI